MDEVQLLAMAGGVAFVGLVAWLAMRSGKGGRLDDAALFDALARAFDAIAARRGLQVERRPPHMHPVVGAVAVPPQLSGTIDGLPLRVTVESEASDEVLDGFVRIDPAPGHAWSVSRATHRRRDAVPAAVRPAFDALCQRSRSVELTPTGLVASPKVPARTIAGTVRRIETDPDRLDAYLELALAVARAV